MIPVWEFIELLRECNPNAIVVMSSDAEGNNYDTLRDLEELMYDPNERWVGYAELTDGLREQGYGEEDVMEDGIEAVVLWP